MKGAPFFVSTIKNISIDLAERCIKGGLMKINGTVLGCKL